MVDVVAECLLRYLLQGATGIDWRLAVLGRGKYRRKAFAIGDKQLFVRELGIMDGGEPVCSFRRLSSMGFLTLVLKRGAQV